MSAFQPMKRLFQSWFELTVDERKALCLVLAIFLLGLAAKYFWLR